MGGADYAPGTVAVATVRGVEGVRVVRSGGGERGVPFWWSPAYQGDALGNEPQWRTHIDHEVTDIRPLLVLDLDECYGCWAVDQRSPSIIANQLRDTNSVAAHAIADQIEAQTKPPRIPEPGLWGVVEAHIEGERAPQATYQWVRTITGWEPIASQQRGRNWGELVDPTLIREGVES